MDTSRFRQRRETNGFRPQQNSGAAGYSSPRPSFSQPVSTDGFAPTAPYRPQPVQPAQPQFQPRNMDGFAQPARPAAAGFAPQQPRPTVQAAQWTPQPTPVQTAQTPAKSPIAISMDLPGAESQGRASLLKVIKNKKFFKNRAVRATAASMALIFLVGGVLFSQGIFKAKKVFKNSAASVAALQEDVSPSLLRGEGDGRVNVLLMGRGGAGHDGADLTDTLMIASIDPVNKTATLLSIPRDLWVNVADRGPMKLNAAFVNGVWKYTGKQVSGTTDTAAIAAGFDTLNSVVQDVTGVKIDYNVLVDFKAFQKAIDQVGGITLNVPEDLVDPTMAWENANNPVLSKAGTQTFDGKKALIYVRSRETSSDFARAQRQRAMLLALKDKIVSAGTLSNPIKLSGLIQAFGDNVYTNFSLSDISRFYAITKDISGDKVSSVSLNETGNSQVTTSTISNLSVVVPRAGTFNYADIQNFVRTTLKDGYIAKEDAKIAVLNGTTTPGLAGQKAAELRSFGYNVTSTGNAPTQGYADTVVVDLSGGKNKYTKNYLEQRYKVSATTTLPDAAIQANGADFVVIIGSNAPASN